MFYSLSPDVAVLPEFVWLKVTGAAGADDVGIDADRGLVVSERVLTVLRAHGIEYCEVEPC